MRRLRFRISILLAATAVVAGLAVDAYDLLEPSGRGASGQTNAAATGTGLLMGVIVDPLTDRPVAESLVTLNGDTRLVLTDAQGRFVFSDLSKGPYTITASKAGYSEGAYGRRRPAGPMQVLPLGDGERIGDLKIPIWKNATITGTITDEAGDPMIDLPVQALLRTIVAGKRKLSPGTPASLVKTDDRGAYRIAALTPGEYVVVVPSTQTSAPESVVDLYRQGRSGGQSDLLRDLSSSGAANVLNRLDQLGGLTVGGLTFQSLASTFRSGVGPMPSAGGHIFVYPTQFYPAALTAAQAAPVTLHTGEERTGVDLQLKLVSTSRVSGIVTGPDGPLTVGLSLTVNADDLSTDTNLETATTWSDAAGRFTFPGAPAGSYLLRVVKVPPGPGRGAPPPSGPIGPTLWATQPVSVDTSDIRDLVVTLRPGFRVAGRLRFDDTANQPAPDLVRRMTVAFDSADGRPLPAIAIGRGLFDAEGQFSGYQLPPGRYYLRVNNPPPGWTLKSATIDGQDVSNVPLKVEHDVNGVVVTFTDHPAEVNGQTQDASGARDAAATVLIFPAESASWSDYGTNPRRLRSIRVDKDGSYRAVGIPAGDYLVVAIADEATSDWQDPKTLQALARVATAVTLAEGEARSLILKTVTVPAR